MSYKQLTEFLTLSLPTLGNFVKTLDLPESYLSVIHSDANYIVGKAICLVTAPSILSPYMSFTGKDPTSKKTPEQTGEDNIYLFFFLIKKIGEWQA